MYWLNTLISGSVLNSGSVIDSGVVLNNGNRPQSGPIFSSVVKGRKAANQCAKLSFLV